MGQGRMSGSNRKRLLIPVPVLVVVTLMLIYFWFEHNKLNYGDRPLEYFGTMDHRTEQNDRNINIRKNEDFPINFQRKSVMNFPEWYRNEDWGLKQNVSLQNITVESRGLDNEEGTAWENFFFGTTKGLMLEMGAMDGKGYSVSAFFENKANWRTILIEGNPKLASYLPINRPNSLNFNYVICNEPRVVHYFARGSQGVDGIVEFMSDGMLKHFFSKYLGHNGTGTLDMKKVESAKEVIKLECIPLTQILLSLKINHVNFFLLDVEGGELSVLKSIDFDQITIDVIAVETDRFVDTPEVTKKFVDSVIELLTSKGYNLWTRKLGRNSWFVSPKFQPFKKMNTNEIT